jgi:amidase
VNEHALTRTVRDSAALLDGLGYVVEPGAPTVDPDTVADTIAVLHNVSNAQLHALATTHLGREPGEDEFEPSTWVMVREGSRRPALRTPRRSRPSTRRRDGSSREWRPTTCCSCPRCSLPRPTALLDRPRGTTRAFFDVEFATTGWTSLANITGWAAISLPLGVTSEGLPIGVQLMAPDETILLQLAAQLENGEAMVTPAAEYVMSLPSDGRPAWCATFVSWPSRRRPTPMSCAGAGAAC